MAKGNKPTPQEIYWARKRKEEAAKAVLLPAGLVNHGNTCFMNSVLQGLVATPLLEAIIQFRLPEDLQCLASRRSPLLINGRGPKDVQQEWVKGMGLGDVFIDLMDRAWRVRDAKERSSMSPKELLTRLGEKYDQYLDFRQQDAHEFLLHLLDGMRMEEFDIIKQRQPPPPLKSKSRARVADSAARDIPEPIPEEDRLTSFVDMVFGGKLASVLICGTCKHVSHTYEDFDDLSLSITHDESKERKRDRLKAFASKFMASSNRDRPQPRLQSLSQPPSPSFHASTLDLPEGQLRPPRRRSFEARSSPAAPESRKIDTFTGVGNTLDASKIGDAPTHPQGLRPRRGGEVGLGKLGRRISVGMSLGTKKEKNSSKVEKERMVTPPEGTKLDEKSNGVDKGGVAVSLSNSKPSFRQPSPIPKKVKTKLLPKLSEHEMQKVAYLRRLLEDSGPGLLVPLPILRIANANNPGARFGWSKISVTHGVEDSLRMFTAVEALDGDNMFGCRNCWKIAHGQVPVTSNTGAGADSEDSSDEDGDGQEQDRELKPSRPGIVGPIQSFSMPNLPPAGVASDSSLLPSAMSSPFYRASDPPLSESTALNPSSLDLNSGLSASTSTTSFATTPSSHTNGAQSHIRPRRSMSHDTDGSSAQTVVSEAGPLGPPIPIIAPISPPPDHAALDSLMSPDPHIAPHPNRPHIVPLPSKLDGHAMSSKDSLRLPVVHSRHRAEIPQHDGNLSSESEYDDNSGVSEGDGPHFSQPNSSEPRISRQSRLPRSKQIIYRRALKRYLIARPPQVLVIHLKRFSKSPVPLFGNLKKLDGYVSFPELLDLRPFLAPKKEDYGLGKGELRGKVVEKGKREEDRPCMYRLYAVVVHIGNMLGGHYIAYTAVRPSTTEPVGENNIIPEEGVPPIASKEDGVQPKARQERQWCYISDTVVRLASLEEVLNARAYLCMYERIS